MTRPHHTSRTHSTERLLVPTVPQPLIASGAGVITRVDAPRTGTPDTRRRAARGCGPEASWWYSRWKGSLDARAHLARRRQWNHAYGGVGRASSSRSGPPQTGTRPWLPETGSQRRGPGHESPGLIDPHRDHAPPRSRSRPGHQQPMIDEEAISHVRVSHFDPPVIPAGRGLSDAYHHLPATGTCRPDASTEIAVNNRPTIESGGFFLAT
jgi:hypothetical protein